MELLTVISLTITLFLILDPFASLPMFINITKGLDEPTVRSYANRAILVAALLLYIFVFVGQDLMGVFGITMDSFRVAGGIIFLMMAIELVFGLSLSKVNGEGGAKWAIIASPVLTGPGVIATTVMYSTEHGIITVLLAGTIALLVTWVILRMSSRIMHLVGEQAIGIVTKVIGLFIAAMGVESIFSGSLGWFQSHISEAAVAVMGILL